MDVADFLLTSRVTEGLNDANDFEEIMGGSGLTNQSISRPARQSEILPILIRFCASIPALHPPPFILGADDFGGVIQRMSLLPTRLCLSSMGMPFEHRFQIPCQLLGGYIRI